MALEALKELGKLVENHVPCNEHPYLSEKCKLIREAIAILPHGEKK